MNPESKRLSEVTKYLYYPKSRITGSLWDYVGETCTDKLGLEFDGWQDGLNNLILATGADGKLVHTVGGFGLSICRQAGKTFSLTGVIFGLCVDYPGLLVIWSAQHSKTHDETFMSMQGFCERSAVKPFIDQVFTGSGDEEVRFVNGSRILFGARERGFGRGIPGVDILVNDEGQILSQRAMQNMLATMNTSQFGLHIYAGTPPKPEDKSETFTGLRNDAIAAIKGEIAGPDDFVWVEMGASDGIQNLDDLAEWARANPSFPHRTPIEGIKRLRRRLDDEGFRREALGIWDPDAGSVFDLTRWMELSTPEAPPPTRAALVVDVSPDRRWSTIGIAGESDGSDLVLVKSVRGTSSTIAEVKALREKRSIIEVAITSGAARALETELVDESIEYEVLSTASMSAAYNNFQKAITDGTVHHINQPELNFAVEMTRTRFLQTGESEAFDRRGYSADIGPAIAAAGALYRFGLANVGLPLIM